MLATKSIKGSELLSNYEEYKTAMEDLIDAFTNQELEGIERRTQQLKTLQARIENTCNTDQALEHLTDTERQQCKDIVIEAQRLNAVIVQMAQTHMAAIRSEEAKIKIGRTTLSSYKSVNSNSGRIVSISS